MADLEGGSLTKIAERLLQGSPPLMLRAICGEAVATVVLRSIPNMPETNVDLYATYGAFGFMGVFGLAVAYGIVRGK